MKNVNFSPSAKHRSGQGSPKGKIILGGTLIFLTLVVAVFWHGQVDIDQGRTLLRKALQRKAPQTAVQIDSPNRGREQGGQDGAPAEKSPAVQEEEGRKDAVQENPSSAKVPSDSDKILSEVEKIDRMKTTAPRVDKECTDYYVKAYSSVIREDAEKGAACLSQMKYSPQIIREPGFAVMRNVYVTANSAGIQDTVDRLSSDGFSVYLQEDSQNQYTIRVGSCYYLESAKSLLKSLKKKGYSGNIVEEKTGVKFYSVFLGKYPHFEMALEVQGQLDLKGFPSAVVTCGVPVSDE